MWKERTFFSVGELENLFPKTSDHVIILGMSFLPDVLRKPYDLTDMINERSIPLNGHSRFPSTQSEISFEVSEGTLSPESMKIVPYILAALRPFFAG